MVFINDIIISYKSVYVWHVYIGVYVRIVDVCRRVIFMYTGPGGDPEIKYTEPNL